MEGRGGVQNVFRKYFKEKEKKKRKRQQFSAWICFWLNPLIIPGFPEREREMERHVLFSNNSYLHPFLPLHCCVVVGHTCPPFLRERLRLKLFYASAPRAPIWKVLCVSFHTQLSSSALLPLTLFHEQILWGGLFGDKWVKETRRAHVWDKNTWNLYFFLPPRP